MAMWSVGLVKLWIFKVLTLQRCGISRGRICYQCGYPTFSSYEGTAVLFLWRQSVVNNNPRNFIVTVSVSQQIEIGSQIFSSFPFFLDLNLLLLFLYVWHSPFSFTSSSYSFSSSSYSFIFSSYSFTSSSSSLSYYFTSSSFSYSFSLPLPHILAQSALVFLLLVTWKKKMAPPSTPFRMVKMPYRAGF